MRGLRAFCKHQTREGDFAWGDAWTPSTGYLPHHEHAWRLEPLIWARVWLDEYLSPTDTRWIDAMLARGARRLLEFARRSPNDTLQYCNRGAVWISTVTLCGLYFDNRQYLRAAEAHAERILLNTINSLGEALENYLHYDGGGPDTGYGITVWAYAIMYRVLSGRTDLDDHLVRAQKWMVRSMSNSGHPLATGSSVRYASPDAWIADTLPGLELLADHEPFFDTLAERLLGAGVEHEQGHLVHPNIWAMLLHKQRSPRSPRSPRNPRKQTPSWYDDFEGHYRHPPTDYSLIRHAYQTGVTWRGIVGFQGLQTFALGDEPPIVHPRLAVSSGTRCGRVDTATENVAAGASGWEIQFRQAGPGNGYEPESPATFVTARRGSLWEVYVFTPASVIYVVGANRGELKTRWVLHATENNHPRLDARGRLLRLVGRDARLRYLSRGAKLSRVRGYDVLAVRGHRLNVFGFGDPNLRLTALDRRRLVLHFRDASGRYTLNLAEVLTPFGQLNRDPAYWHRVTRM